MARVHVGSLSITGDFRSNNEDRFSVDPDGRFFLVADGMGGQSAGEQASEMAIVPPITVVSVMNSIMPSPLS